MKIKWSFPGVVSCGETSDHFCWMLAHTAYIEMVCRQYAFACGGWARLTARISSRNPAKLRSYDWLIKVRITLFLGRAARTIGVNPCFAHAAQITLAYFLKIWGRWVIFLFLAPSQLFVDGFYKYCQFSKRIIYGCRTERNARVNFLQMICLILFGCFFQKSFFFQSQSTGG